MNIGDKILELRKSKGFSQEDIANKLNVSRQTVSKWETNCSTPDFDKIVPLCQLFDISTDEFLMNKVSKKSKDKKIDNEINYDKKKYAFSLSASILLYFVSVMWIIFADGLNINDEFSVVIFLGIIAVATVIIVYSSILKKDYILKEEKKEKNENSTVQSINNILALVILCIYLIVSFYTMAWSITWILWIVYALITEIVKLIFKLGGSNE